MSNKLSNRANSIELSGIRKFYNKVQKVEGSISLTLGQPDFKVPKVIKDGMILAIEENKTVYTANAGIVELREEISNYLRGFNINYDKDEICVTVGGSEGLTTTFLAIINSGDKVLIPSPGYPAYESNTKLCGGIPIEYSLNEKDFSLELQKLEELIEKEKPKAIVISFPSNPTGGILSKENKEGLIEILKNKDILIITDEIYTSIYYGGEYHSLAQSREVLNKIIYVSGFSKMFSMTGLRLGYVCASPEIMNGILKVHQYNVSCATSIVQYGVMEGLKKGLTEVEKMKGEFEKRRDYVYDRLIKMGLTTNMPQGAFYIFPSIKKFGMTSEAFCDKLLYEKKIAVVPGSAFGTKGEGYFRISYAYSMEELTLALDKIEEFIGELCTVDEKKRS